MYGSQCAVWCNKNLEKGGRQDRMKKKRTLWHVLLFAQPRLPLSVLSILGWYSLPMSAFTENAILRLVGYFMAAQAISAPLVLYLISHILKILTWWLLCCRISPTGASAVTSVIGSSATAVRSTEILFTQRSQQQPKKKKRGGVCVQSG